MKIALNILLTLAAIGLIYLLVESIRKPINFTETRESREEFVRERLTQAAELQKVYKSLRGNYADSYDSLKYVLTNDTFLVDKVTGDEYDTTVQVKIVQVKSENQLADIMTKPLSRNLFQKFRKKVLGW